MLHHSPSSAFARARFARFTRDEECGPIVIDRVDRIRMRMALNRYPAVPELVAQAMFVASRPEYAAEGPTGPEVMSGVQDIVAGRLRAGPPEDLMLMQLEFVEELPLAAIALLMGVPLVVLYHIRSAAMARLAHALAN
jgi:hypothetical protein